jgi:hypothetical protein
VVPELCYTDAAPVPTGFTATHLRQLLTATLNQNLARSYCRPNAQNPGEQMFIIRLYPSASRPLFVSEAQREGVRLLQSDGVLVHTAPIPIVAHHQSFEDLRASKEFFVLTYHLV